MAKPFQLTLKDLPASKFHRADEESDEDEEAPVENGSAVDDRPPEPEGPASTSGREVNRDLIILCLTQQPNRTPITRDVAAKSLAKLTHLHLNGQKISCVGATVSNVVPKLEVLYLYDNQIDTLAYVARLSHVTHLYLQNNLIYDVSPLGSMEKLQKLYLQGNEIAFVSGLDNCSRLEELHLSEQRMPVGAQGSGLALDPDCMAALSPSLRVLSINKCGISRELPNLEGLAELRRLTKLDLSHNKLADAVALEEILKPCMAITSLDLRDNPLAKNKAHRDGFTIALDNLATLDDEAVQPAQREFLLRLHMKRLRGAMAADRATSAGSTGQGSGVGGAKGSSAGAGPGGVEAKGINTAVNAASRAAGHKPLPQRAGGYGVGSRSTNGR